MTTIKTAKIDNKVAELILDLGINFSGEVNSFLKEKYQTISGINNSIKELNEKIEKLKKRRDLIWNNKKKMSEDERKYFIETGQIIKKDKKFIIPRIRAIYDKFDKIVESEDELLKLIEVANGRNY